MVSARTRDPGWQGSFDMQYLGDRYNVALNTGRSVTVSGNGGFNLADQIMGSVGYTIDERSSAGFTSSLQNNKGQTPNTMLQLGAWASHELSQFLHARLYYQHKLRSQNGQPDASGDALGVTLVYSPRGF
jgi:hypothetical protein